MTITVNEQNAYKNLIDQLEEAGVRCLRSREELVMKQAKMLASFARAGVPSVRWKHLERCRGQACLHRKCSAACQFGENRQLLELILPAQALLTASEKPLWFVTIIDPRYRCAAGELAKVSINAMQQWLRRRIEQVEKEFGPVCAIGGIEVSFERDAEGDYWGAHTHFALAADAPKRGMERLFCPREPLPPNFKPVVVKPVTNLANCLAYCNKRAPAERAAYSGSRGTQDRYKHGVDSAEQLEHDLWLLGQRPTERLFMRGFKRVHGKLTLIGSKP